LRARVEQSFTSRSSSAAYAALYEELVA